MANDTKEVAKKSAAKPAKPAKKKGTGLVQYLKEVIGELKKLTWPTPKELVNYTLTVLAFILVMAVIIYALDLAFGEGLSLLASINVAA